MLLINRDDAIQWRYGYFSYLLIWCIGLRKVKTFGWWCDSAICIYRCAKKTVHRIGSHIVHKWKWYDCHHLLCNTSASATRWDRVLYNSMAWIHIWICSSMFIVNNPSSLFPLPYMMKSYDVFPKFHVCKHILSAYYKWFLVESIFNIFIFKLNEFNMDVHLCFKSTILI